MKSVATRRFWILFRVLASDIQKLWVWSGSELIPTTINSSANLLRLGLRRRHRARADDVQHAISAPRAIVVDLVRVVDNERSCRNRFHAVRIVPRAAPHVPVARKHRNEP